MLSAVERNIISRITQDIPLVNEPFKALAVGLGLNEDKLIQRIKTFKEQGLLRKFCATLNHRKAGFKHNLLAVWNVPAQKVTGAAKLMVNFSQISHCYERTRREEWNYNLYSMIHARSRSECLKTVRDISKKINCRDYRLLFSSSEYKKSAVRY